MISRSIETLLIALANPRLAWIRSRKGLSLRQLSILSDLKQEGRFDGVTHFLDAGAHHGEYAESCLSVIPGLQGLCFEPTPETFSRLESRFRGRHAVRCLQVALGAKEGTATLMRSPIDQANSLLPMDTAHVEAWEGSASQPSVQVKVRPLDDLLVENGVKGCFLLKVDVQGYEKELLLGAENTLKQTRLLQLEMSFVNLYDKGATFEDVWSHVHSKGFRLLRMGEFINSPKDGLPLQGDLLFIKA